jgi:hypothetical protein
MSQRSQEIIRRIQNAAEKAGNRKLDLNRREVKDLHKKNKEKTYKEFMNEAMGRHQATLRTELGGIKGNVADPETQEKMDAAKKKDKEEAKQKAKQLKTDLHIQRTQGLGILGNYKGYGWGYLKTDPKTGKKTFTPKDN